ncbi:MAG TPA: phosphatidate cytidylyltransferase [Leptospiraceae bacterium]|nr:phosphatidate cytidylyltransferase [Leptospiraceae bacterium]HMW04437.1 phosphatidate cytidylyltransferase [Leptospiraceae bacterium]HMX35196.1 phosphatidate cytidylyltransferase [Leptospiraceae bacterium]HMY30623.1 phosphatidate cytidylyltransferase [Leptospiraceae bacterium]HMZ64435.1 phosphatidate cytidylyltransferase [Leptospiraceae bacterium]
MLSVLENPIFISYLKIVSFVLTVAFLILFTIDKVFKKDIQKIWKIYYGWLIMVPIIFLFILIGRTGTIVGINILSLLAYLEFARATKLNKNKSLHTLVILGILSLGILCYIPDPLLPGVSGWYGLFMALPVYMIGAIMTVPTLLNRSEGMTHNCALAILGFIYFGWMFSHLNFLTNSKFAIGYLFYLLFAVEIGDVSAFVFGKIFGKHKLRSEISPNKTLEGSIGSFFVSMLLPWLLSFSFPLFTTLQFILTGLIVGIGGQLGDLTISFIKRDIGIKDMGTAIPGHGGILDRVDSLIFTAPIFFHMTRYFEMQ